MLALQDLARKHGSLLIVDDIQVGCGRTGTYFSFEDTGLEPDLVCLAKGIGGFGIPLAILLIKPEHDIWSPGEHTGTFRGQNLSFVAGSVALQYFKSKKFLDGVKKKGKVIEDRLAGIVKSYWQSPCLRDDCYCPHNTGNNNVSWRGKGMIYGLCLGHGKTAAAIVKESFANGLLIASCGPEGKVLKLIPPLTIEDEILGEGLDILENAVKKVISG